MNKILSLSNTTHIAKDLGKLVNYQNKQYASGEYITIINEALEGKVIVMGNIFGSNIIEFLSMIDAAKRAGAKHITLIIPYFGYARQDKMEAPYSSVGFEIMARMINAFRVDKLIVVDIHSHEMLGLFDCEIVNVGLDVILNEVPLCFLRDDNILISPDEGSYKRINNHKAICLNKTRKDGCIFFSLDASIHHKNCFIIDDLLDSGATIKGAIDFLYQNRPKKIIVYVTHILSRNIPKEIILTTDSLGIRKDLQIIKLGEILRKFL